MAVMFIPLQVEMDQPPGQILGESPGLESFIL
jgi:hypothetical protein